MNFTSWQPFPSPLRIKASLPPQPPASRFPRHDAIASTLPANLYNHFDRTVPSGVASRGHDDHTRYLSNRNGSFPPRREVYGPGQVRSSGLVVAQGGGQPGGTLIAVRQIRSEAYLRKQVWMKRPALPLTRSWQDLGKACLMLLGTRQAAANDRPCRYRRSGARCARPGPHHEPLRPARRPPPSPCVVIVPPHEAGFGVPVDGYMSNVPRRACACADQR